jgi:hypothetical protein
VLLCSIKAESSLRTWGIRLATKIGFLKARVAVARKIAVIMMAMWKTGASFDPDKSKPQVLQPEEAGLDPVHISGT